MLLNSVSPSPWSPRSCSRCIAMSPREARGEPAGVDNGPGLVPPGRKIHRVWIAGFAVAGVLYIAVAAFSTRISDVPLSAQFGILQLLPASYWVGIGLIGIANALALRERSDALTLVTGTLLLAAFAVTPNLFEPNARYWDAYLHLSEAEGILALGHLPAANLGQYSANWPGAFLVFAALLATSGMPAMVLLVLYPIVSGSLTFVAIFIFLRSTFPRPVAGPGAILGSLFAVWAQF